MYKLFKASAPTIVSVALILGSSVAISASALANAKPKTFSNASFCGRYVSSYTGIYQPTAGGPPFATPLSALEAAVITADGKGNITVDSDEVKEVMEYAARLVLLSHPDQPDAPASVKAHVKYGASPRGAQAIIMCAKTRALALGRYHVALEDVKRALHPALRRQQPRSPCTAPPPACGLPPSASRSPCEAARPPPSVREPDRPVRSGSYSQANQTSRDTSQA